MSKTWFTPSQINFKVTIFRLTNLKTAQNRLKSRLVEGNLSTQVLTYWKYLEFLNRYIFLMGQPQLNQNFIFS